MNGRIKQQTAIKMVQTSKKIYLARTLKNVYSTFNKAHQKSYVQRIYNIIKIMFIVYTNCSRDISCTFNNKYILRTQQYLKVSTSGAYFCFRIYIYFCNFIVLKKLGVHLTPRVLTQNNSLTYKIIIGLQQILSYLPNTSYALIYLDLIHFITMTGVNKNSHQKKCASRQDFNNNDPVLNLEDKFDDLVNANSPIGGVARPVLVRSKLQPNM